MIRAIGVGFGLLLLYVAWHTLPVQWVLTILILSGAVTLALLPKPEYDPRRWLPSDEDEYHDPLWFDKSESPWTLDDERAFTADCDLDEERE